MISMYRAEQAPLGACVASSNIYPPPCLWHAERVVATRCAEIPIRNPFTAFRNSCWISTLWLEIPPEFRLNLSENLIDSRED